MVIKGVPIHDLSGEAADLSLRRVGEDPQYGLSLEVGDRECESGNTGDVEWTDWYETCGFNGNFGLKWASASEVSIVQNG